ncbi:hypothetical protein Patl1_18834 [Pistacia atlantica]|uniref:Uncharacterized protein n=1 Tax=Pistacia atlantica TaxID=434234 RepID=A0ACC1C0T3_9ROSI|nr:hypothetical protein Patl1_18834 [Pistacia atlantica]
MLSLNLYAFLPKTDKSMTHPFQHPYAVPVLSFDLTGVFNAKISLFLIFLDSGLEWLRVHTENDRSRFTMRIFLSFFFLFSLPAILAQEVTHPTILVDGTTTIAMNDENFICATLDWWPHDKCNYDQCPWHYTSAINLDLSHPLLTKAIQAFKSLRIRLGGSLQDQVLYDVGDLKAPCHPFRKMKDGLFGFSKGCLHMDRWDKLNHLFNSTGAIVTFGLNALYGRHQIKKGVWGGAWDPSNARDFMKYTILKGYHIDSWEFGNELSGSGVGASVDAELYGKDLINLKNIVSILYRDSSLKPLLVAPGGFFEERWFSKLLQVSGSGVVNTVTHHIYNLGAGELAWYALLWHRLMGKGVLAVATDASSYLRAYAHCSKGREGITVLLINLSNQTEYTASVQNSMNRKLVVGGQDINRESSFDAKS